MLQESTYHMGVLSVSLHIPQSQSLKDKRMHLRSIKDKVRNKFNVSIAEIAGQDKWQVATLAIAMLNSDQKIIDSSFQHILELIDRNPAVELCEQNIEFM